MASHGGTISIEAQGAGDDAGLRADRRRRRRPGARGADRSSRTSLCTDIGGTSFDIALITDGRFEITPTPDIARFMLNMPLVQIDSIGAGTGLVRPRQPELGPARARAPTRPARGSASAGPRAASRRSRSPTSTSSSGASTPTTSSAATSSSTPSAPAPRSSARSPSRSGSGSRTPPPGVIELFEQTLAKRGRRAHPRQGLLARRLRAALLRRRRAAARRRLHRGGRLPRRAGPRLGGRLLRLRLRLRRLRVPLRPDDRHADPAGRRRAWRRRASGCMVTGAWLGLRGAGGGRVREVGRSSATRSPSPTAVRMQYYGQLNDIEIVSPHMEMEEGEHVDALDRRVRGGVREGLRALGPLARARLPDHPGDRPRLGRGREAGAAGARRGRAASRRLKRPRTVRWRDGVRRDRDRPSSRTSRPATRSPGPAIVESLGDDVRDPARAGGAAGRPPAYST